MAFANFKLPRKVDKDLHDQTTIEATRLSWVQALTGEEGPKNLETTFDLQMKDNKLFMLEDLVDLALQEGTQNLDH